MNTKKQLLWAIVALIILLNGHCHYNTLSKTTLTQEQIYLNLLHEAYHKIHLHFYGASKLDKQLLFYNALKGVFHALDDPHSTFLDHKHLTLLHDATRGAFTGLGIQLSSNNKAYYISKILPHSPASKSGLQLYDQLIKINTHNITNWPFTRVIKTLRGKPHSQVTLTLVRKRKNKTSQYQVTITRKPLESTEVVQTTLPHNIGYVKLNNFSHSSPKKIHTALSTLKKKKIKGLIFDLRSNPGGDPISCLHIINYFFNERKVLFYTYNKAKRQGHTYFSTPNKAIFPSLPLVVLANKKSASASEIFLGAIQDHKRGTIIGHKTYGKGSVQTYIKSSVDPSVGFKITSALWFTPNGTNVDKKGITPDITIPSPKLSKREKYILTQLKKSNLIHEFLQKYPKPSPYEKKLFIKLAHNKGYKIKASILLHALKKEKYIHENYIQINPQYDPALYKGFTYLKRVSMQTQN